MTPQYWQRLEELFDATLQLPIEERSRFLDEQCGSDHRLRTKLSEMLSREGTDDTVLNRIVQGAAATVVEAHDVWEGRRLGAYRVLRTIGRGGMGTVFLAVRDDDQYRKEVAIKTLKFEASDSYALNRFRQERQVLAGLEHPNIARLLDGGSTDQGTPYLVMEFVDGEPITEHCRKHGLSISARLRLFQQVCEAVQYAHGMLVVHRDIKPANILVTADGVPKLLDFGIAKLLDPTASPGATAASLPMMTPEYASPEQVRGEVVSTSTDVYSLGMVLYEMLAGRPAYEVPVHSPVSIALAVCDTEPRTPGISGDLDNILLMALRKEPQRRYASVRQFADDLERSLTDRPVRARPDTIRYRSAKFVRRHRLSLIAGAVLVLTLLAGVIVSQYQARRAERLFREVREMASVFLFDFDESIRDLPGTTKARERLVATALKYFDRLSAEARADSDLTAELATAYDKIGDVQGNPSMASLGHTAEALGSWERSRTLWERIIARDPNDVRAIRSAAQVLAKSADLRRRTRQGNAAEVYRRATTLVDQALALAPQDEETVFGAARVWYLFGDERRQAHDFPAATNAFGRSLALYQSGSQAWHTDRWQQAVAINLGANALVLTARGDVTTAIQRLNEALAIRRDLAARNPNGLQYQRGLATTLQQIGNKQGAPQVINLGDIAAARASYRESIAIEERLAKADPQNEVLKADLSITYRLLADVLMPADSQEAGDLYRKSLATVASMKTGGTRVDMRDEHANDHEGLARIALLRGANAEALREVDLAIASDSERPAARILRGDILLAQRKGAEARLLWEKMRSHLERDLPKPLEPVDLRDLGELYLRLDVSCAGIRSEWETRKVSVPWPLKQCR